MFGADYVKHIGYVDYELGEYLCPACFEVERKTDADALGVSLEDLAATDGFYTLIGGEYSGYQNGSPEGIDCAICGAEIIRPCPELIVSQDGLKGEEAKQTYLAYQDACVECGSGCGWGGPWCEVPEGRPQDED